MLGPLWDADAPCFFFPRLRDLFFFAPPFGCCSGCGAEVPELLAAVTLLGCVNSPAFGVVAGAGAVPLAAATFAWQDNNYRSERSEQADDVRADKTQQCTVISSRFSRVFGESRDASARFLTRRVCGESLTLSGAGVSLGTFSLRVSAGEEAFETLLPLA